MTETTGTMPPQYEPSRAVVRETEPVPLYDRHGPYHFREQPLTVTMDDRARGHHLGIKPRAARQQAMEDAAMPVSPIHHRGDGESMN